MGPEDAGRESGCSQRQIPGFKDIRRDGHSGQIMNGKTCYLSMKSAQALDKEVLGSVAENEIGEEDRLSGTAESAVLCLVYIAPFRISNISLQFY